MLVVDNSWRYEYYYLRLGTIMTSSATAGRYALLTMLISTQYIQNASTKAIARLVFIHLDTNTVETCQAKLHNLDK